MRYLSLFFLLSLFSLSVYSQTHTHDYFEERVAWVKSLKELMLEIESKSEFEVTESQRLFKEKFTLIEKAWAQSEECFFAGWPSIIKKVGNKKFCTSPLNAKLNYQNGNCQSGELQCQPLLFGKNVCVAFSSPLDKSLAFSKCESKFKKEKKNYDFLRNLSAQEANDLQNLSVLAHKVCEEGSVGIQEGSGMCKKLMEKFDDGIHSIAMSQRKESPIASINRPQPQRVTPQTLNVSPQPRNRPLPVREAHTHDEDCPPEHLQVLRPHSLSSLMSSQDAALEEMYHNLKNDFQNSPHCQPENVLHDPSIPNSLLFKEMIYDLGFLDYLTATDSWGESRLKDVLDKYKVSSPAQNEVKSLFTKLGSNGDQVKKEIKRIILQDYSRNASQRNKSLSEELKALLVKNHIFSEKDGEVECPFMSKDSFFKAVKGMQKVKNLSGVKNKNLLTVVDYTQPSNNRRLYVVDLESNKILHNTWVAHGGGGNNVFGSDGLGGSPTMSNRSGSNQSSDGFVVAGSPSYGSRFGNNLILNGVDSNNGNMRARAVIMHGWDSPGEEFATGKPKDVRTSFDRLNAHSSVQEFKRSLSEMKSATFVDRILRPTEGCLGVPRVKMTHLDSKRRDKSMIDVLREDLAGTVIFNYSGSGMKSKFL